MKSVGFQQDCPHDAGYLEKDQPMDIPFELRVVYRIRCLQCHRDFPVPPHIVFQVNTPLIR